MSPLRLFVLASTTSMLLSSAIALAQTPTPAHISKADFEQMMTDLSNWGRWGDDDQLGTVNLITPAKRKAAAQLVTEGVSVSLSRDTDSVKGVDNGTPVSTNYKTKDHFPFTGEIDKLVITLIPDATN